MAAEYRERREIVYNILKDIPGIKTNKPDGAFYFFPDISSYFGKSNGSVRINNATDLSMYLLEGVHVSVVTGEAFGAPKHIRLSYAASRQDLAESLQRIESALSQLN